MSAETLRKAAGHIRSEQNVEEQLGRIVGREYKAWLAVADWLDSEAAAWELNFAATRRPSPGIDVPPAVHYGDLESAARGADYRARYALAVANAYLGGAS